MDIHRVSKLFHNYVVAVTLVAGFFVAMMSFFSALPGVAYAATPFGGLVTLVVPEQKICGPGGCVTICPKHMTVINYGDNGNLVGVYSGTFTKIYDYGNLYQIGKYLLGDHALTPYPTCLTPYRVYQLSNVGTS